MERDGEVARKRLEVPIRRQDGQVVTLGHGTEEEVGVRALYPVAAAEVEMLRGTLVIHRFERQVRKGPQPVP